MVCVKLIKLNREPGLLQFLTLPLSLLAVLDPEPESPLGRVSVSVLPPVPDDLWRLYCSLAVACSSALVGFLRKRVAREQSAEEGGRMSPAPARPCSW